MELSQMTVGQVHTGNNGVAYVVKAEDVERAKLFESLPLDSLMWTVIHDKNKVLEQQTRNLMTAVDERNRRAKRFNEVIAGLMKKKNEVMLDTANPPTKTAETLYKPIDDIHKLAGISFLEAVVTAMIGSLKEKTYDLTKQEGVDEMKAAYDVMIKQYQNQLDSENSTQQLDLAKLQDLTSKNAEGTQLLSTFLKRLNETNVGVVRNIA